MSQSPAGSCTDTTTDSPDGHESDISSTRDDPDAAETGDLFAMDAPRHLQISGEVQVFDHIFAAAGAVADSVRLGLSTSTLAIRAAGPMGHAMVDLSVDGDSFETFQTDSGPLGVAVGRVRDALSIGAAGALAQVALDTGNSSLEITINGISRTVGLEPAESLSCPPDIPSVELPATAHFEDGDLSFALKAATMVNDRFDLVVEPDAGELRFEATGDTDSMVYRREQTDLVAFDPADVQAKFDADLTKSMRRGLPSGATRVLHIGDDVPLVVRSQFPNADGACQFIIAPKLPNE
jgi:proliferating cell nuclear antigen